MLCCNSDCAREATIHIVRGQAPATGSLAASCEYEGESFCSVECLLAWSLTTATHDNRREVTFDPIERLYEAVLDVIGHS